MKPIAQKGVDALGQLHVILNTVTHVSDTPTGKRRSRLREMRKFFSRRQDEPETKGIHLHLKADCRWTVRRTRLAELGPDEELLGGPALLQGTNVRDGRRRETT